jgi:hypothetical protein
MYSSLLHEPHQSLPELAALVDHMIQVVLLTMDLQLSMIVDSVAASVAVVAVSSAVVVVEVVEPSAVETEVGLPVVVALTVEVAEVMLSHQTMHCLCRMV